MKNRAGIWIDAKQAVVVFLEDQKSRIKKLQSTIDSRVRVPGEGKWFTRMGSQFFDFSYKKKAHRLRDRVAFFKEVQNEISGVDQLVLFGPAAKKNELKKYLLENGTEATIIRGVETADSMTDNQVVAWVIEYFKN